MTGLRELPRFVQVGLCLSNRCSGRPSALALQKHHALACWQVPSLDRDETSFSIINMTWGENPTCWRLQNKEVSFWVMSMYQLISSIRKAHILCWPLCIAFITEYWLLVNNKPLARAVTASWEALKHGERLRHLKLLCLICVPRQLEHRLQKTVIEGQGLSGIYLNLPMMFCSCRTVVREMGSSSQIRQEMCQS